MENYLPDQAELRRELLEFREALKLLERKRESSLIEELELDTLIEVLNREAIDLVECLGSLGLLDTVLILSPTACCVGMPVEKPAEAWASIAFGEWSVLSGWDEVQEPFTEEDTTVPSLQPVQQ